MTKRGPGDNRIGIPCGAFIFLMFLVLSSIGTVSLGHWLA